MTSAVSALTDANPYRPAWWNRTEAHPSGLMRPRPLPGTDRAQGPDGQKFYGGPIQAVHTIGDFQIVEYLSDVSGLWPTVDDATGWLEHGQTRYRSYVAGRSTSHIHRSLDSALVYAVAFKRRGPNTQAAHHFDLMTLGEIPTDD